jgi:hypothetical protein
MFTTLVMHHMRPSLSSSWPTSLASSSLPPPPPTLAHTHHHSYVLDFILERKSQDDLRCSVQERHNRYDDQKYRLRGCGAGTVLYLVEGDVEGLADKGEGGGREGGGGRRVRPHLTDGVGLKGCLPAGSC